MPVRVNAPTYHQIIDLRLKLGMTIDEFACLLGAYPQTVEAWEYGTRPSVHYRKELWMLIDGPTCPCCGQPLPLSSETKNVLT
jgi:DNA-binding transcriptional regulator YiaG